MIFPHFSLSRATNGTGVVQGFGLFILSIFEYGAPRKESIRSLKSVSSELSQTVRV